MAPKPKLVPPGNFSSILDTPASEVSRPKPSPAGDYHFMVRGLGRQDKSAKKGTPFVEFTCAFVEASDTIDEDALKEWLTKASGEVKKLSEQTMRLTFYLTEDALWRLMKFLQDLGVDTEDNDRVRSVGEMLNDVPGRHFWGHVKHTPSDDGETMFANIDQTAPFES